MKDKIIRNIVLFASMAIIVGLIVAFLDLESFGVNYKNDGLVAIFFSLAGIILYFGALVYQAKEYKLQIVELQKSVEAQTNSSKALEDQKKILIEQYVSNVIFGLISDFKQFKKDKNIEQMFSNMDNFFLPEFINIWNENAKQENRINTKELNEKFVTNLISFYKERISQFPEIDLLKKHFQFSSNILYVIEENKENYNRDYFTSTFFIQLDKNEMLYLFLSDYVDCEFPTNGKFEWKNNNTLALISFLKIYSNNKYELSELESTIITEKFIQLKRNHHFNQKTNTPPKQQLFRQLNRKSNLQLRRSVFA